MNGNVSQDGIRKDIQWMHESGITGFHVFDAGMGCPQIVPQRVDYLSPEWKECLRLAVSMADSLHMDVTIPASPGWSCTGGPWVEPKDAMKKLTWRSMHIHGGQRFKGLLPEPFDATGNFLDMDNGNDTSHKYYRDIAVIAVKTSKGDGDAASLRPTLRCSGGDGFSVSQLNDERLKNGERLTPDADGKLWLEYIYPQPQTIRALTLCDGRTRATWTNDLSPVLWHLECSDDGTHYEKVCDVPMPGAYQQTISIPTTTARHFRLVCDHPNGSGKDAFIHVSEFALFPSSRVNLAEERAGFTAYARLNNYPMDQAADAIPAEDVIDITSHVDAQGRVTWNAPRGEWQIYRFGYSLTGKVNHPASPKGTGLEVDKMDKEAVARYLTHYLDIYREATGGLLGKRGITGLLIDSYEAGNATWTTNMEREFTARRGYDLRRWLPTLAGRVIGSSQESERFLYDWRKTIGELICDNLYGEAARIAHENGMTTYFESDESCRQYLADGMQVKSHADIPMGAMWTLRTARERTNYAYDISESSSASHVYGRKLTAGESMTADGYWGMAYSYHPGNLKEVADHEMACGLNKFIIHESAHQPVDDKKPGLSLGQYGQWFTRHETWAGRAGAWTDYLGRSCYLLQQGTNVADIAYYYGSDNNVTALGGVDNTQMPKGYNHDFIGPQELTRELSASGKHIVTRGGASYRMLWIAPVVRQMSIAELQKINELAESGIFVYGNEPQVSSELQADSTEWRRLVNAIWHSGRRNVMTLAQTSKPMQAAGIEKDVDNDEQKDLNFIHRRLPDGDIYWISNAADKPAEVSLGLKSSGKKAEVWHPEDGRRETAHYQDKAGRTNVNLRLCAHDAVFVMLLDKDEEGGHTPPATRQCVVASISDHWTVAFEPGMGAPAQATEMPLLASLTESDVPGIKYFSGKALYSKDFDMPGKMQEGASYQLHLGQVGNMATVTLNGQALPTIWHEPYSIDITSALRQGKNHIEIEVINPWRNRIIGDRQPGTQERVTYLGHDHFFDSKSELMPSGLMGPVTITEETALR